MIDRDRTRDLDTLADAVIQGMWNGEEIRMDNDCPARYAAYVIGLGSWDHDFSKRDWRYAETLWYDVFPHIQARWAAFREAERA